MRRKRGAGYDLVLNLFKQASIRVVFRFLDSLLVQVGPRTTRACQRTGENLYGDLFIQDNKKDQTSGKEFRDRPYRRGLRKEASYQFSTSAAVCAKGSKDKKIIRDLSH